MTSPVQIRRASQSQVATFLARQREDQAASARAAAEREKDRQEELKKIELQWEAWESAATQLLDEGCDIFGSDAAARLEFDRIADRRARLAAREIRPGDSSPLPSAAERRRALLLALRQAAPLILVLVFVVLPVTSYFGAASSFPLIFAIGGAVWYVHSRMLANLKEMRTAVEQ